MNLNFAFRGGPFDYCSIHSGLKNEAYELKSNEHINDSIMQASVAQSVAGGGARIALGGFLPREAPYKHRKLLYLACSAKNFAEKNITIKAKSETVK